MATHSALKRRIAVEKRLVTKACKALLAAGFHLYVEYDDDDEPKPTRDWPTIRKRIFDLDQAIVYVYKADDLTMWHGYLLYVFGNDGWDVLSDYSVNLEPYVAEANALADKLSEDM